MKEAFPTMQNGQFLQDVGGQGSCSYDNGHSDYAGNTRSEDPGHSHNGDNHGRRDT